MISGYDPKFSQLTQSRLESRPDDLQERSGVYLARDLRNPRYHAVSHGVSDEDPVMNVVDGDEFFWADAFERQLKRKMRDRQGHTMGPDEVREIICRNYQLWHSTVRSPAVEVGAKGKMNATHLHPVVEFIGLSRNASEL